MNALQIALFSKGEPYSMYLEGEINGRILTTEYEAKERYYYVLSRFDKRYAMVIELNWLGVAWLT